MKSQHECPDCRFEEKRSIGRKFKICAYCLQPVDSENKEEFSFSEKKVIPQEASSAGTGVLRENTSFLTTSGVAFLAISGLHMSPFNAIIFGIICAVLIVGLTKPTIVLLKLLGGLTLFFLIGGKLIEAALSFVDQAVRYFELWEFFEIKDKALESAILLIFPRLNRCKRSILPFCENRS